MQLGRYVGIYYQQSPNIFFTSVQSADPTTGDTSTTGIGGFMDMNSLLLALAPVDMLEVSAGPSFDYVSLFGCNANAVNCASASGAGWGLHGRLALNLGGRDSVTGRRSGFQIALDEHPMFGDNFLAITTVGIGGEWF
jgi:hypothetical protein